MTLRRGLLACLGVLMCAAAPPPMPGSVPTGHVRPDPYVWLEDVTGARAMDWVRAQNAPTVARLEADPRYAGFYRTALDVAQSSDRIPLPRLLGGQVYNLWQDARHVQGIWRRTTLADYRTKAPHWTTVLDLDALSRAEGRHWVWEGVTCWSPEDRRCLISLSDGGEDAVRAREFDLRDARFVPGGFDVPRAKMVVGWLDRDTLLLGTDWGPGSLTASGYPFIIKRLRRGQTPAQASEVFRGDSRDVSVEVAGLVDGEGHHAMLVQRGLDFFSSEIRLVTGGGTSVLALPRKITLDGLLQGRLIVTLNESFVSGGRGLPAGSLAALDLGKPAAPMQLIFAPGPRQSVDDAGTTRGRVVATVYDNVRGRAMVFSPVAGGWRAGTLALPDDASVGLAGVSARDDQVFLTVQGFLQPSALYWDVVSGAAAPEVVKALPAQFDASGETVDQHEAVSADGTRVPYFLVHPKGMRPTGANPTLLYAYGGFQVSETPVYSPSLGRLWLDRGGVYALANIRGGGEFGPAWHEAGLKTHRQRIYDDFAAVARDLIATRVTDARHLGIRGRSNGGLLMGVEFTQHPELYKAVIIGVPLLDMLRFEQIAAGASWVGEYGSVANPAERDFLAGISPYNNLRAGVAYPEPFIFTTTKDDRVGPVHARKFAARLAELHVPYLYYESVEGGHAGSANLRESAREQALEMTYLGEELMPGR